MDGKSSRERRGGPTKRPRHTMHVTRPAKPRRAPTIGPARPANWTISPDDFPKEGYVGAESAWMLNMSEPDRYRTFEAIRDAQAAFLKLGPAAMVDGLRNLGRVTYGSKSPLFHLELQLDECGVELHQQDLIANFTSLLIRDLPEAASSRGLPFHVRAEMVFERWVQGLKGPSSAAAAAIAAATRRRLVEVAEAAIVSYPAAWSIGSLHFDQQGPRLTLVDETLTGAIVTTFEASGPTVRRGGMTSGLRSLFDAALPDQPHVNEVIVPRTRGPGGPHLRANLIERGPRLVITNDLDPVTRLRLLAKAPSILGGEHLLPPRGSPPV